MTERMVQVFLGVGSNIDPRRNLLKALEALVRRVRVTGLSSVYRTAPIDRSEQPAFLNCVWRIETAVSAFGLKFDLLMAIEEELGRVRTADRYAARTIDLDILLYGEAVIDQPDLRVPDPDIRVRPFIAVPLLELAPELVLPDTGERLSLLVQGMDSSGLTPVAEVTSELRACLRSG